MLCPGADVSDTYTCEACGETLQKGWSDLEAAQESATLFPGHDDMAVVCDDCFQKMAARFGWPVPPTAGPQT